MIVWLMMGWDVTDVLNHLKTLPFPTIDLKTLSKKLGLLVTLLRTEITLTLYIKSSNIHVSTCGCSIFFSKPQDHTVIKVISNLIIL